MEVAAPVIIWRWKAVSDGRCKRRVNWKPTERSEGDDDTTKPHALSARSGGHDLRFKCFGTKQGLGALETLDVADDPEA
jgi:hypothetical protein